MILVIQLVYVRQVGKFCAVWAGRAEDAWSRNSDLSTRVGYAASVRGRSARKANLIASQTCYCWPTYERGLGGCEWSVEACAKRRLVNVDPVCVVRSVSANVSNVDGQAIGYGALHVQIPRDDVRLHEIGIDSLSATGWRRWSRSYDVIWREASCARIRHAVHNGGCADREHWPGNAPDNVPGSQCQRFRGMNIHHRAARVDSKVGHFRAERRNADILSYQFRLSQDAGAGSHHRLAISSHVPSQAEARRERLVIRVIHVADWRSWTNLDNWIGSGRGIGKKCALVVRVFDGISLVFPAQTQIQREPRGSAEIILEVTREPVSSDDFSRISDENCPAPRAAFEEMCQILEFDLAIGLVIGVVVIDQVHKVKTKLEGVFAAQPGDVVYETCIAVRSPDPGPSARSQVACETANEDLRHAPICRACRLGYATVKAIAIGPSRLCKQIPVRGKRLGVNVIVARPEFVDPVRTWSPSPAPVIELDIRRHVCLPLRQ